MKIKAAVVVALVGLGVGPAGAQSRWADEPGSAGGYVEGLPQRVIMRSVRMQGLMPVSRPMRREGVYVVEAVDEFDRPRRVLVDARSARVVAVQPSARLAPRPYGGGEYAMRPPRGIPGGSGLPPRARPDDEFGLNAPQAGPPPLPPLRRPPVEHGALAPAPAPSLGEDAVPPPPPRREANPAPAAPRAAPRSAAVSPAHPPAPRPRPATTEATGSTEPAASAPSKPKGLPRVVLPGGPLPKSQRTAETRPGQREHDDRPTAAAPAPKAPEPPASAASGAAEIPPAQTLE